MRNSLVFCQLETAFYVRMNCVSTASSAAPFAFPQLAFGKEGMMDDVEKKVLGCCTFQIFISVSSCPSVLQF